MENYKAAFLQRAKDVEVLHLSGRRIAAMHMGGIAIECLLKHLIFTSLPPEAQWEWKTETNDPGHTISNPGHSYDAALKCYNRLRFRINRQKHVEDWLKTVENPDGHFIDMRYTGKEPDDKKYKQWLHAYTRLVGWLKMA